MRSILVVLTWETLLRHGWLMLVLLASSLSFLLIYASLAPFRAPATSLNDASVTAGDQQIMMALEFALLPAVIALQFLGVAVGYGSTSRLYAKPLSNAVIAVWPLIAGGLTLGIQLPLIIGCYNYFFDAGWPVASPTLFAITLWVVAQPFLLVGSRSLGRLLITAVPLILMCLWYLAGYGFFSDRRGWVGFSFIELLALAVIVPLFCLWAMHCVAADRCGESQRRHRWWNALISKITNAPDRPSKRSISPFRSPLRAQLWYQWRLRGWGLGWGIGLLLALLIGSVLAGSPATPATFGEIRHTFPSLGISFALVCGLYGFVMGFDVDRFLIGRTRQERDVAWNRPDALGSFLATRPMSDVALAQANLIVCVAAVSVAALIYGVVYAGIVLVARWDGAKSSELPWVWLPVVLASWWIACSNVMTMVCTGRTRQWLTGLGLLCSSFFLLEVAVYLLTPRAMDAFLRGSAWLFTLTIAAATLGCYGIAYVRGLLSARGLGLAILFLLLFLFLCVAIQRGNMAPVQRTESAWLLTTVGTSLFLLPFAAMPLAIVRNRHQ